MVIAVALLSSCIKDDAEEVKGANIQVGDNLPSLSLKLSDGTNINDSFLAGKVSVILFFNTSCADCAEQLPIVESVYQSVKDDDEVALFAVSRAQGEAYVEKYWEDNEYTLPYSAQSDIYVYSLFAKRVVPRIYIADKKGVVRFMYDDNPIADEVSLKNAIGRLLNE